MVGGREEKRGRAVFSLFFFLFFSKLFGKLKVVSKVV